MFMIKLSFLTHKEKMVMKTNLDMNGYKINGLPIPTNNDDLINLSSLKQKFLLQVIIRKNKVQFVYI